MSAAPKQPQALSPLQQRAEMQRARAVAQQRAKGFRWQPLHPSSAIEAALRSQLLPLVEACEAAVSKAVVGLLEDWPERTHEDAASALSIQRAVRRAALSITEAVPMSLMGVEVQRIFASADRQHREAMSRQFSRLFGTDILRAQPELTRTIATRTGESVKLIRSIPTQYLGQVEVALKQALVEGKRGPDVKKLLQQRFNVTRTRAEVIVKDQMGKFYAAATTERNQQLGIQRWRWRTMKDGRVRPEHVALEGRVFEYGKPPSEGMPGEPVLCRCFQEPLIEDVL